MKRNFRYFSCDFETTVYKGQERTEVWASAVVEMYTEDVKIFHSIGETFEYFESLNSNLVLYYHNLKFDGNFWIAYLMENGFMQAYETDESGNITWVKPSKMPDRSFQYMISDMGQWYTIKIKTNRKIFEIRDSLKLIPFSVKEIGRSFNTKHKKLDMEYEGFRYAGCTITDSEKEYIKNDVLVVKEALEYMFDAGHDKLTIGSCCLSEYKNLITESNFETLFPDVSGLYLDSEKYGADNVDAYIRKSYRGGWCYVMDGKEGKVFKNGLTVDVNGLYSSVMHSSSGNRYPVGYPAFWKGNNIPDEALKDDKYYFIRIRTRFYLKEGHLPFVQIKGDFRYRGNEMLKSSDVCVPPYESSYIENFDGTIEKPRVTFTFTQTDYELFLTHYNVIDFEILDGCYFASKVGIFDKYIDKYQEIKANSKYAKRTLAKLFLNNLYGKLASGTDSSFKVAYLKECGVVGFYTQRENNKQAGYIPAGSAVTSYAKNFTIKAAQKNYDSFIYADTDSIHCDIEDESELAGVPIDDNKLSHWKIENHWDIGVFIRQKTYLEHIISDCVPSWNVKCAGMPDSCKNLLIRSMEGGEAERDDSFQARKFLETKRTYMDFKRGLKVPGKLMPKRIRGGIVLVDTFYEMR